MSDKRRMTHRRSKGMKLYPVYDSKGRFEDIKTYARAHEKDMKKRRPMTAAEARLVEAAITFIEWCNGEGEKLPALTLGKAVASVLKERSK